MAEEDDEHCLQVIKSSNRASKVSSSISSWALQVLRSLTCQCSFMTNRRNPSSHSSSRSSRSASAIAATAAIVPLLHRSFSRGLLTSGNTRLKFDPVTGFGSDCSNSGKKDNCAKTLTKEERPTHSVAPEDFFSEQLSSDSGSSIFHGDGLVSSGTRSVYVEGAACVHAGSCESDGAGSSPRGSSRNSEWQALVDTRGVGQSSKSQSSFSKPMLENLALVAWEEERVERRKTGICEVEIMKVKFAKLLLGEDMSGGGKGVCTALAISNAITNLSVSMFGELWRLEPLSVERKSMWRREMSWFLSVTDHIVELVPSWQKFPDGSKVEVMLSKPRSDIQVNLPALQKLDAMLLDCLESFNETEFWYADQGIVADDPDGCDLRKLPLRQEEKWWLPTPKVSLNGLSEEGRKSLQHQRECVSQILKAAMAINNQVLSEMEVPVVYWDALPKSGKASLGDTMYKHLSSEYFSAEAVLCTLNLSTEHNVIEMANRIEAAIHIWRYKRGPSSKQVPRQQWGIVRDVLLDDALDRRDLLAGRAENLLACLKQKFPGLRQSLLDMTKIQYNRDVGQSILESYSRVTESLAFNIIARIEDVLYVDDLTKRALARSRPAASQ